MSIESERTSKPLNGEWVYGLKISQATGERKLARRWYAMEFEQYERVLTREHTDYPGVNVIDLFEAPTGADRSDRTPIGLEAAMERNPKSLRFLLSVVAAGVVVVTSQIGYKTPGEYSIDQLDYAPELPEAVDLFDVASCDPRAHLTDEHVQRLHALRGDPVLPLAQQEADNIFRVMTLNTSEVR